MASGRARDGAKLEEAFRRLEAGQARDAAFAFETILREDPTDGKAREGLETARGMIAEAERPQPAPQTETTASGRILIRHPHALEEAAHDLAAPPSPRQKWSRSALVLAWTVLIAAFGGGAALSFDSLLVSLTERPAPRPASEPPLALFAPPARDTRAIESAEGLIAQGDWKGALRVIDTIPATDPAYPRARELRAEAERLEPRAQGASE